MWWRLLLFVNIQMGEETLNDVFHSWLGSNSDVETQGFLIDITNIDAALVVEENDITLTLRVDTHVSFFLLDTKETKIDKVESIRVRAQRKSTYILVLNEWFNDKTSQLPCRFAHLKGRRSHH